MNSSFQPHFFSTKFEHKAMLTSSFIGPNNNFSSLVLHTFEDITFAFDTSIPNHIRILHYREN